MPPDMIKPHALLRRAEPVIRSRVVHLDLKGLPPTPERLLSWLGFAARCGYNGVLVEWEDQFPWTVDACLRSPTCYCPATVRAFCDEAQRLGLELIPLVQCLGHLEFVLRHERYAALREQPHRTDAINPLATGASDLLLALLEDVRALMPGVRRFHLGGDEAWAFGTHPETRHYVATSGKAALYLRHITPLLDRLHGHQIRPMLWHDMMLDWDGGSLRELGQQADLVVWGYRDTPATTSAHHGEGHILRFAEAGVPIWGATAYRGGEVMNRHLPDAAERQVNALGWTQTASTFGMRGVIATGWSRFSSGRMQCEPRDAALDCMALVGAILHDGCVPAGGTEACREWAAAQDPLFAEARPAVAELSTCLDIGWQLRRLWEEQVWLSRHYPVRDPLPSLEHLLPQNRRWRTRMNAAAERVAAVLSQGVDPSWVAEYIDAATGPILQAVPDSLPEVPLAVDAPTGGG